MDPPPTFISIRSGFFFGIPASLGCVETRRRNSVTFSRFSSIFLRLFSGLKFSGRVRRRSRSSGGFFIQASVRVSRPYGVLVYARMAQIKIGGVSTIVAVWAVSLPKSGDAGLSSIT